MSILNKVLIGIGALLLLCALGFIIYKQNEISTRQQTIETSMVKQKELVDGTMRSQNEYATKADIDKMITDNGVSLKAIQDDLKTLHAEITAANTISVVSTGQKVGNLPSSHVGPANPNPTTNIVDTYGYFSKAQLLDLHENFEGTQVPIGQVGFSAWQQSPWNISILPRDYKVTNVIGTDENNRTYVYNKVVVNAGGKDYNVKITSAETKQEFPDAKWNFWNPKLFLGADGGVSIQTTPPLPGSGSIVSGQFVPSLSFGFISYGRYKPNPIFSVAQIGLGVGVVDRKPELVVTPIAYNLGQKLPFISNTYIGPSVTVGTSGAIGILVGMRIGL